jgi:hypothetical protein
MADQPTGSVFEESQPTQAQEAPQAPEAQEGVQSPPQQESAQQQPPASSDDLWADQLSSIKNERGEPKYRDLPTALDALKHSQEYIPTLKQENETLKEKVERMERELQERKNLEETIDRLTAKPEQPAPQEYQGLTEEQITGLLEQRLAEREAQQKAESNAQQVEQALLQRYGDKARDVVSQKCQEYGMSPAEMQEWARKNPKAVSALFDVKPTPQGKTTTSSVNIPPTRPNTDAPLERPEKSLLSGATTKDIAEYMRRVREDTHKRLGVTE